jgi:hypothetical protein
MSSTTIPVPYHSGAAAPSGRAMPRRSGPFLVQIMIEQGSGRSASLGRADRADQREHAYGEALANRPSAQRPCALQLQAKA